MASPLLFRMRLFPRRHHSEAPQLNPVADEAPADDQQLEQLKAEDLWLEEVLQPLLSEVLKRHSKVESFVDEINEWGPVEDFKHSESAFEIKVRAKEMLKDLEQVQLYLYLAQLNLLQRNEIFKEQKNRIYESVSRFDTFYSQLEKQLNEILRESGKFAKQKVNLHLDLKIQNFMDQMNQGFRNCDLVYRPSKNESFYQCADFSGASLSRERARESSKASSDSKGGGSSSGSGGKSSGSRASESKSTPAKSESKAVSESVKVTGSAGSVRVEVTRSDARGNVTEKKSIETNNPKAIESIRSSVGVKSSSANFEKTVSREIGHVEIKGPDGMVSKSDRGSPLHVDGGKGSEKTSVVSNPRDKTNEKVHSDHSEVNSVDHKSREPISARIGKDFPHQSTSSTSSRADSAQRVKADPKSHYELKFSDYTVSIVDEFQRALPLIDSQGINEKKDQSSNLESEIEKTKRVIVLLQENQKEVRESLENSPVFIALEAANSMLDAAKGAISNQTKEGMLELANELVERSQLIVSAYGPVSLRMGVSALPIAGDIADSVELVSGKDVITGAEIGPSGRIFAAMGLIVGSRVFWQNAAKLLNKEAQLAMFVAAEHYSNAAAEIHALKAQGKEVAVLGRSVIKDSEGIEKIIGYEVLSKTEGATFMSVPNEIWKHLEESGKWDLNKKFLDRIVKQSKEIVFSHDPRLYVNSDSFFGKEIRYLLSKGFKISDDGLRMIRP